MIDSIPAPVHALLEFFTTELSDVKFPEMDADILTRATDEVRVAAETVARAESALETARAALADRQDALLLRAQRALAYARVFTEEDARLAASIEAIVLPRSRRPKAEVERDTPVSDPLPARRRGRPAKTQDAESATSLFEKPQTQTA